MNNIREAAVADAEVISDLMRELGYEFDPASLREKLEIAQSDYRSKAFVALSNDKVVAVVTLAILPLFHTLGAIARITSLIVTERYRTFGIGKMLVEAAEEYAWKHGCAKIEVTTGEHRKVAQEFYDALDYDVDERRFLKSRPQ